MGTRKETKPKKGLYDEPEDGFHNDPEMQDLYDSHTLTQPIKTIEVCDCFLFVSQL
jgi:hypothetical protein